jgi:hypothetical protein
MTDSFHSDLLYQVETVGQELGALSKAIADTRQWRQRAVKVATIAALVAAGAFLATGLTVLQAYRNTDAIHQSQIAACHISNQTRAGEVQLWTHVVEISKPPPGQTPAQARQRQRLTASFLDYVRKTFRPLDCERLYAK